MKPLLIIIFFIHILYSSPLHKAVTEINEAKVALLLKEGADINALNDEGQTALIIAAPIGRYTLVKQLIEAGANLHIKDNNHKTALVYAIEKNRIKVIMYLSKVASLSDIEKEEGLFEAAQNGDMDFVAYYLSRSDINRVNKDGKTALHLSAEAGQFDTTAFLLHLGADASLLDYDGRTALNYAKLCGNKQLVDLLLEYKSEPNDTRQLQ